MLVSVGLVRDESAMVMVVMDVRIDAVAAQLTATRAAAIMRTDQDLWSFQQWQQQQTWLRTSRTDRVGDRGTPEVEGQVKGQKLEMPRSVS